MDLLKLELQVSCKLSYLTWVLGTELQFFKEQ